MPSDPGRRRRWLLDITANIDIAERAVDGLTEEQELARLYAGG